MNKLCINVFCGFEFEELCRMAKEIGFDGIFSDESDAVNTDKILQNRIIADRYSLYYETSHSKIKGCEDIWSDTYTAAEYEKELKLCIDNCAVNHIGILVVHIQTGNNKVNIDCGMKSLQNIINYAGRKNVKIAFENINNSSLLYYVMDNFRSPSVGFCYDSGHELCHTPGENFLDRLGDRLICTHLHDNDGSADQHCMMYTKAVNFSRIASQLKELKYTGGLSLELAYSGTGIKKREFLSRAYEGLKKFYSEIAG